MSNNAVSLRFGEWMNPTLKGMPMRAYPARTGLKYGSRSSLTVRAESRNPRVLWLTNLAPPYRRPVWEELAKSTQLIVALLENKRTIARDERKNFLGRDWQVDEIPGVVMISLKTRQLTIRRIETRLYLSWDRRLLRLIRDADAVVIGGWESPAYWQALFLCRAFNIPRIGFYESTEASSLFSGGLVAFARRRFIRALNRVVVPGIASQRTVVEMGVNTNNIHVGFNAVDVAAFSRASFGESDERRGGHSFAFVGKLISRKRVDAIVRSFAEISSDADELQIIGVGPLINELQDLVRSLGVQDRVTFRGYVLNKDLPEALAGVQTLVLASEREVWGLVVNEALAAGCHVVVTENCGCAASVRGMRGVYLAKASGADIPARLAQSRADWSGRVSEPEILCHTPESFAHVFLDAIWQSLERRRPAAGLSRS